MIHARKADQDAIDCGDGNDVVFVDDAEDGVFDCEDVATPTAVV